MLTDTQNQYQILAKNIPKALEFIDIHHTVMFSYGYCSKGHPGVVTVGHNPAPSSNERNLSCVNSNSIELNMSVIKQCTDNEQAKSIFETSANYFNSKKQHPYFKSVEHVINQFGASYFFGITNNQSIKVAAVHIDMFKWSTSVSWAQVPQVYSDAMLNTNVLLKDLQHLKPQIIILAVSLDKLIRILPDINWTVLAKFEKDNTKRMEVVYVYYAKAKLQNIGQVFMIQTTPSPNPFGKLKKKEKIDLGKKIQQMICD